MDTSCDWLENVTLQCLQSARRRQSEPGHTYTLTEQRVRVTPRHWATDLRHSVHSHTGSSVSQLTESSKWRHQDYAQGLGLHHLGSWLLCSDSILEEDPSVTCKAKHGNTEWCSPQNQKPITQLKGLLILSFKNKILYLNVIIGT